MPSGHTTREADLSPARLLADAAAHCGSDDWGDLRFVEPLALLLDSCRSTDALGPQGRQVLRQVVLRHLGTRLAIRARVRARPREGDRPLGCPLVITGLPRTGTTLLHNLLAQDPHHRVLRLWEALWPAPDPDHDHPDRPRLQQKAQRWLDGFHDRVPAFRAIHPQAADGPEECDTLLQRAFASQHLEDMFDAPAYAHWRHHGDLSAAYDDHTLQLRLLSSELCDRRWVLKSPGHVSHLGTLRAALPGARVLHCHRDPTEAVPSYASLIRAVREPNTRTLSLREVGDQALERCRWDMERAMAARAADGDGEAFLDVAYGALTADPIGTVQWIYDWLPARLDGSVVDAMRAWLAAHPRDRHGVHRYEPADFGLPPDRVRATLAGYLDRFGELLVTRPARPR